MPHEPISAAPQPATLQERSLRSAQAPSTWPSDAEILAALGPWMLQRRWFPLKGDAAPPLGSLRIIASWEPEAGVRDLVIAALRGNQAETGHHDGMVLLHVPVVLEAADALDSFATPGEVPGNHGLLLTTASDGAPAQVALVDGAHHPAFWRAWALSALREGTVLGEAGALAITQRAPRLRVTTGEQSNTSVILPAPTSPAESLGEQDAATGDLIVKLLRVLEHGRNPDVELSVALARSGWDRVRTPVAWSTLAWTRTGGCGQPALDESTDSAVACSFVPRADDGFELFCSLASTDDVDGPVRARAVDLARDLGRTTAQMHHHLAVSLGTSRPPAPVELAAALRKRARWALEEVPEISGHIQALELRVEQALERLEALEALEPATRIHGDYHLGQVLHEVGGQQRWYVLDFEGEPLRPLAQRSDPDLPARDVAGMLRSFDYAAAVGKAPHPDWLGAVRTAFEEGYQQGRQEIGPEEAAQTGSQDQSPTASHTAEQAEASRQTVLTCLELDKALYEAVYEARNRPDWLSIPMAGIESVLSTHTEG
ncbi:phosphotransferase [Actinomyces oris]|uniref:1,4-alpha-glucan branching protein n=1 Tax=Actinomyces oris TaxID=544580 RepID=A0A1Q8V8T0_9ACTO|nr:phosphotransferase [Actinomyces oris]OLO44500.1 1,4-alpha-glucan branching protein [Actinomyces oris]